MHYLFYGEDTFSINEKVKNLANKFKGVHSDLNVFNLDGDTMTLENYTGTVNTPSFFGNKKLVVIRNFLIENKNNDLKKDIAKALDKIPETSTVLFVEQGLPDMRSVLFKKLNKPKLAQKFDFLSPFKINAWIEERVKEEGGIISSDAKEKLLIFVGQNLWRLDNEIKKLVLYKNGTMIGPDDVEKMVFAESNSSIFNYIDALAERNAAKALSILGALIASGEEEFYIFTMIIYQFRNLLFVSELMEENLPPAKIASEAKIHPFVIRKSQGFIRHYTREKLQKTYGELQKVDYKIKSGTLDLSLALDYLTTRLCRAH